MSQNINPSSSTPLAIVLPERVFARGGGSFDPRSDLWEWADGPFNARIDFRRYSNGFEVFVPMLKQVLLPFVKGYSSGHVVGLNDSFAQFANVIGACPDGSIGTQHISDYKVKLEAHKVGVLGKLNVLLQKWVALGLAGVEPECVVYLLEQRKPSYKKGNAVRTRDPIKGPLSEEEYTALYSAVNASYGRGELPLWTLLLTRLLFACGGRICQYASLKLSDFDGATLILSFPQAKAREEHLRSSFLQFDISSQTGQLITDYVSGLRAEGYDDNSAFFPKNSSYLKGQASSCETLTTCFTGIANREIYQDGFNFLWLKLPRQRRVSILRRCPWHREGSDTRLALGLLKKVQAKW